MMERRMTGSPQGFAFLSQGKDCGYLAKIRRLIEGASDGIAAGAFIFSLPGDKAGYPGSHVFLIDPRRDSIEVEGYTKDPTRFPARLKACARALWQLGMSGRFRISHREGVFSILHLNGDDQRAGPNLADGSRLKHLDCFYHLLSQLEKKVGGKRSLSGCHGRMNWPTHGLYHFFEMGEVREQGKGMRVVRVGTHAVSQGSRTTLWDRLSAHRGHVGGVHEGGGNHRGSIFRLHIGGALVRRDKLECPTWGQGQSAVREVRDREYEIEAAVSRHIRGMPFLWLKAGGEAGPSNTRAYLERNSIGLLSNCRRAPIDPPSPGWLGHYCPNIFVRESGLWNVRHVPDEYDPSFLAVMEKLIRQM